MKPVWSKKCFVIAGMVATVLSLQANVLLAGSKKPLLGFVQVSAEGTWRMTNSKSIKEAAEKADVRLIFREGENNYSNQLNGIRELITSGVDVLAFSPSQVDGWDEILTEAKTAGIPVVVVDRAINVKDESLYVTHIGSDMIDEGKRAANWLLKYMAAKKRDKDKINIVVLEGVAGSTPAVHRDKGFREVLGKHSNFSIVASEPADFIFSKGEEVMSKLLKMHKGDIDVVFAHNDEMALGAVEAIKKYGKKPGVDVVIIGVDAIKKAVEAIVKGEMNATIECSPLLGPQLMEVVKEVVSGKKIERRIITIETDFDASNAVKELPARTY